MAKSNNKLSRGAVAWMARNPVAANLAMLVILVGGAVSVATIKQEIFPEFELDFVNVTVPYPGASPAEVEQGVILAIEEAVRGIDGVKRVTATAREGFGTVSIELLLGAKPDRVHSDIKNEIDRITTFPEETEEPTVAIANRRRKVIDLIIAGDFPLRDLHEIAEKARARLLSTGTLTQVEIQGVRPLEIAIEVSRETLESYGLTLEQIAAQVRAASIELPGGRLDTNAGQLLVRVTDRRKRGQDFANIIIRGTATGGEVRLGDIASINDGYEDNDQSSYYNGKRAVRIRAYRVGDETPTQVSEAVRNYVDELKSEVPPGVEIATWDDDSQMLRDRIDLLIRNARTGLLLVLLVLGLFLNRRLAGWVALGIPISFMGAFCLMSPLGVSINMVTLFALIVTLGIVVDDAIVVGENIHIKTKLGLSPREAAIAGAQEMTLPVTFSILTTVAAFAPLLFVPGFLGKIFRFIPIVVIAVLVVSLFESFFILPAHLSHGPSKGGWLSRLLAPIDAFQAKVSAWLERFIENSYRPFLERALAERAVTLSLGVSVLVITISVIVSGLIPFSFFPNLEGDVVKANVRFPVGSPVERTLEVRGKMQAALDKTIAQFKAKDKVQGVFTLVGQSNQRGHGGTDAAVGSHLLSMECDLVGSERRSFGATEFAAAWRKNLPTLHGVESLTLNANSGPGAGAAVDVQVSHYDTRILAEVSDTLTKRLVEYSQITDIVNSFTGGKPQLDFSLQPQARTLGLTSTDIARSLRSAFFGAEALREQRGRNELKVMVRLPEAQRNNEEDVRALLIGTSEGMHVPMGYVANIKRGRAPTEIIREEGQRVINVSGELAPGVVSSRPILESLTREVLPKLRAKYPGLKTDLVGTQRERNESLASLGPNFVLALFIIYALLAVPLRSYIQPAIIMAAIPFGIVGAVLGHALLGFELTIISAMGIIAVSGVVVNDSLVLVDAVNRFRVDENMASRDAVIAAGMRRFRPILLTSLTTFFGLLPMIFETSRQARFLIPMAISLGCGVLFATLIALVLVPCFYCVVEDLRTWLGYGSSSDDKKPDDHILIEHPVHNDS